MTNIHLMCGIPASGKSTWANYHASKTGGLIISRDIIRYSLVSENEDYFSKEDHVFATFVYTINEALNKNVKDIYIDATHISSKSRAKLLDHINTNGNNLICEVFPISIYDALARNLRRTGRAQVPESAIYKMYSSFKEPSINEFDKYKFNSVTINIHEGGKIDDLDDFRPAF